MGHLMFTGRHYYNAEGPHSNLCTQIQILTGKSVLELHFIFCCLLKHGAFTYRTGRNRTKLCGIQNAFSYSDIMQMFHVGAPSQYPQGQSFLTEKCTLDQLVNDLNR